MPIGLTISARQFGSIRKRISGVLSLSDQARERLPAGWSISPIDPLPVSGALRHLRLRDGLVLRAYQFYDGHGNGNAETYAVPADAPFPAPADCGQGNKEPGGESFDAPKPPEALSAIMEAFDGDGSPASYIEASILARELSEFGAMWHGCSWSAQEVLDVNPLKPGDTGKGRRRARISPDGWTWLLPEPDTWRPNATVGDDGSAIVHFCTYSGLGQEAICLLTDTYLPGSLVASCETKALAYGQGGFVY